MVAVGKERGRGFGRFLECGIETINTNGSHVLFVRSGWKPIEFEKGKAAIAVPSLDKLPSVIETLIAAVRAGELDQAPRNVNIAALRYRHSLYLSGRADAAPLFSPRGARRANCSPLDRFGSHDLDAEAGNPDIGYAARGG